MVCKQRLIVLMKTLLLRRTKQELQSKSDLKSLPNKIFETVKIVLDQEEKLVHKYIIRTDENTLVTVSVV